MKRGLAGICGGQAREAQGGSKREGHGASSSMARLTPEWGRMSAVSQEEETVEGVSLTGMLVLTFKLLTVQLFMAPCL